MTNTRTTAGAKGTGPGQASGAAPVLGRWRCTGCGHGARTRGEAGDLSVEWLIVDPSMTGAELARFHHRCRPAGIPGDGACLDCGDGPLIEAALDQPTDLLTASAVANWFTDHGWSSAPDGRLCPRCTPDLPVRREPVGSRSRGGVPWSRTLSGAAGEDSEVTGTNSGLNRSDRGVAESRTRG